MNDTTCTKHGGMILVVLLLLLLLDAAAAAAGARSSFLCLHGFDSTALTCRTFFYNILWPGIHCPFSVNIINIIEQTDIILPVRVGPKRFSGKKYF